MPPSEGIEASLIVNNALGHPVDLSEFLDYWNLNKVGRTAHTYVGTDIKFRSEFQCSMQRYLVRDVEASPGLSIQLYKYKEVPFVYYDEILRIGHFKAVYGASAYFMMTMNYMEAIWDQYCAYRLEEAM